MKTAGLTLSIGCTALLILYSVLTIMGHPLLVSVVYLTILLMALGVFLTVLADI